MIQVITDCISKIDDWLLAGNTCYTFPRATLVALNPKVKQQKEMVQEFMSLANHAEKQSPKRDSKDRAVDSNVDNDKHGPQKKSKRNYDAEIFNKMSMGTFVKTTSHPNPTKRGIFGHNANQKDEHCIEFHMEELECTNNDCKCKHVTLFVLHPWIMSVKQSAHTSN